MKTLVMAGGRLAALALALALAGSAWAQAPAGDWQSWVRQLDDDDPQRRDDAEAALVEALAAGSAGDVRARLEALPAESEGMSRELRRRLQRVRLEVERRLARQTMDASRVTVHVEQVPLSTALAELTRQTGNPIEDVRAQFGQPADETLVTLHADDLPFWEALDLLLDAARLAPYPYAGTGRVALVNRPPGAAPRSGRAAYAGAFRIEAVALTARRDLRVPEQSQLRVDLEFAWEPRWEPIAVTQPAKQVRALLADGLEASLTSPEAVFEIDVQPGSHAAELSLALRLPSRGDAAIDRLTGDFTAIVPAERAEFVFDDLTSAEPVVQTQADVTVTRERLRRNGALWELPMRLSVQKAGSGLESHRGWAFQNPSVMRTPDGEEIEHVGFETTRQSNREIGITYLFELPEDLAGYAWIYRTPAALAELSLHYELRALPLP
jgi:hypothetical protein